MVEISDRGRGERLFDKALLFREDLYRALRDRVGNPSDAEDLTQETYLRFYKRVVVGGFCPSGLKEYLFRIGINQSNKLFRERRKRPGSILENSVNLDNYDAETGYNESLEFLQEKLGRKDFSFLLSLIELSRLKGGSLLGIIDLEIENLELLKERLSVLHGRYSRDGKIVLPPKEVVRVEFDPLTIRFRSRSGEDPLRFFRKHLSVYGGLSRLELARFDPSLYNCLRRSNQIREAIPLDMRSDKSHGLSDKEQRRIVSTFESCQSSARAAAKVLPYSANTILRYCKRAGVNVRKRRGILESERERIVEAYGSYEGVVSHAAKALHHSRKLVKDVWEATGLEISSKRGIEFLKKMKGQHSLSEEESKRIVVVFEECSGVIRRASQLTGHSPKTIKKYWENEGLI